MATYFAMDFNSLRIFVFTFSFFVRRDWATIVTTMEAATERANAGFSIMITFIIRPMQVSLAFIIITKASAACPQPTLE